MVLAPFFDLIFGERAAGRPIDRDIGYQICYGPQSHPILLQQDGPGLFGVDAVFREKFPSAYACALCATVCTLATILGRSPSSLTGSFTLLWC